VERFLKRFYRQKKLRAPLRLSPRSFAFKKAILTNILIFFLIRVLITFEISPVFSQTSQSATQLVRQGKDFYDKAQYRQAIEKLQQAVNSFAKSGDTLNQSVTLSNLSLAYQELGEWKEAEKTINQSLQIIGFDSQKLKINHGFSNHKLKILAPSLDIYGKLWFNRSQPEEALKYWQFAGKIYHKLNKQLENNSGLIQNQINQVQVLQSLGLYQQARVIVGEIEQNVETLPPNLKVQALTSLGDILRVTGDLKGSQTALEQALTITKSPKNAAKTWLSLGNTFYARGNL